MTGHRLSCANRAMPAIAVSVASALVPGSADAALPGADAALTRAPYLSDRTVSSVQVSWATTGQSHGVAKYGPPGDCTANNVTSTPLGYPITVNGLRNPAFDTPLSALTALAGSAAWPRRWYDDRAPFGDRFLRRAIERRHWAAAVILPDTAGPVPSPIASRFGRLIATNSAHFRLQAEIAELVVGSHRVSRTAR